MASLIGFTISMENQLEKKMKNEMEGGFIWMWSRDFSMVSGECLQGPLGILVGVCVYIYTYTHTATIGP